MSLSELRGKYTLVFIILEQHKMEDGVGFRSFGGFHYSGLIVPKFSPLCNIPKILTAIRATN